MSDTASRRPARAPAGSDPGLAVRFCSGEVSVGRESQRFIVGHKAIPVTRP